MYTYYDLLNDINYLARLGVETGAIGSTVEGRLIPYAHTGQKTGRQIIITGGIHAREHISSYAVVRQLYRMVSVTSGEPDNGTENGIDNAAETGSSDTAETGTGGVYFIPMVNPDGNLIATEGLSSVTRSRRGFIEGLCAHKEQLYKANANGVDLNTNFDARWGTGKSNVFRPDSANFVGYSPCSEPETKALCGFTMKVKPACTISYHAAGREIYWDFYQEGALRKRTLALAECVNAELNYKIVPNDFTSAGGYKDWCIETLKIPALTIELAPETCTHPITDYSAVISDIELNLTIPQKILDFFNTEYR